MIGRAGNWRAELHDTVKFKADDKTEFGTFVDDNCFRIVAAGVVNNETVHLP